MLLTYDRVVGRDAFVVIADAVDSERIHSYARYLAKEQRLYSDPRMELARELLSAALCVHEAEVRMLATSDAQISKPLNGLLSDIFRPLADLPQRLWDALLNELGNGRGDRALTILQAHNNTVKNIIHSVDLTTNAPYDAALSAAVAD